MPDTGAGSGQVGLALPMALGLVALGAGALVVGWLLRRQSGMRRS
jgi:hypothetical protein